MDPKKATLKIKYNDKDITRSLSKYTTSFSYDDAASGESDSVSVTISDKDKKWSAGWLPDKKDTIYAEIITDNFKKQGEHKKLVCGTFVIDSLSIGSSPRSLEVGAISGLEASRARSDG